MISLDTISSTAVKTTVYLYTVEIKLFSLAVRCSAAHAQFGPCVNGKKLLQLVNL